MAETLSNSMTPEYLRELISGYRFRHQSEKELQEAVEQILTCEGFEFEREHRLTAMDRPDFFVIGSLNVVIEIKVKGSSSEVSRQLLRYAKNPAVGEIILLTTRSQHYGMMPPTMNGKPVSVVVIRNL